ncbi:Transcriptional regulator, LacI family [Vibrio vulnificus]|nr:Transcriptional regulator, LacI family [Vibrio vulnificus]
MHCIEEQFRRFGYHVIVTAGNNSEQSQRESVEFLLAGEWTR